MAWNRGPTEQEERHTVVISRHWNNPNISITVNHEKIEIVCNISDFVSALAKEMKHPFWQFTRKQQDRSIKGALFNAIEKIKQTTNQVM